MKTVYDIQQLLKRFGIFIYTGNRLGDLQLIEMEIKELHEFNCIDAQTYQTARLVLIQAINDNRKGGETYGKSNDRC